MARVGLCDDDTVGRAVGFEVCGDDFDWAMRSCVLDIGRR